MIFSCDGVMECLPNVSIMADKKHIHDRMPVILPEHLLDSWIRPDGTPGNLVGEALVNMEFEKAEL